MQLNLNDKQLQDLLGAAIVAAMSQEGKDEIIKQSLNYLTAKQRQGGSFNSREVSPLQLAFERALDNEAYKVALEVVAEPEFKAKMQALVAQAAEQLFSEENKGLVVQKIAMGIQKAFEVRYD